MFFHLDVWNLLEIEDFNTFDEIIENNPNIVSSLRDNGNRTLLMNAVLMKNFDAFKHILLYGQDFTVVDENNSNVFHWIPASCPDELAVKMFDLINQKHIVQWKNVLNHQDKYKGTTLHTAAWHNKHQTIQWMMQKRIDTQIRDEDGRRPDEQNECDEETKKLIRRSPKY